MEGAGAAVVGTGVVGASVGVTVPPQALGAARRYQMCHKTCSCFLVPYFGTLFWDDITKIWNENLSSFTFLTGQLRKNLFWTNKIFVYLLS